MSYPLSAANTLQFFEIPQPDKKGGGPTDVFVLGATKIRYTVLSQQVRAIYLIKALMATDRLNKDSHIGIIGGGIAGTTAAYTAIKHGIPVTLFERNTEVLSLFANASHRKLHPHLYDWPRTHWHQKSAGLPWMNWTYNKASDVAADLLQQFKDLEKDSGGKLTVIREATSLKLPKDALRNVQTSAAPNQFSHLIVAVGPGRERPNSPSYWEPDTIAEYETGGSRRVFRVIGVGDGGMIDSLRIRLRDFDEDAIIYFIQNEWDRDERRAIEQYIPRIEGREYKGAQDIEHLDDSYAKLAAIAKHARQWMGARLRDDTELHVKCTERRPMAALGSPLNRFLFACLRQVDGSHIKVSTNKTEPLKHRQTDNKGTIWRTGPLSELKKLSSDIYKRADHSFSKEQLDLFDRYDDITEKWNLPAYITKPQSQWNEETEYPAKDVLTTRYCRFEPQSGRIIGEHERRGPREDGGGGIYLTRRPISVIEAICTNAHILVIGEYGSGKSHVMTKLLADAKEAHDKNNSLPMAQRYPQWKHVRLTRPFPLRLSAMRFALWLKERGNEDSNPWRFAHIYDPECRRFSGLDGMFEHWIRNGLLLIVENWSDVSRQGTRDIADRNHVAHQLSGAINTLARKGIHSLIVITTVYEPTFAATVSNWSADERDFLQPFERYVIASLDDVQRQKLIQAFVSASRGSSTAPTATRRAFDGGKLDDAMPLVNRLAQSPAVLRQLLGTWESAGYVLKPSFPTRKLYERMIVEYFWIDPGGKDVPQPLEIATHLRHLLTHRYYLEPGYKRITFAKSELEPWGLSVLDELEKRGSVVRHAEDDCYSIASSHIQDLLVGWGVSLGDHLVRTPSRAIRDVAPIGSSVFDRILTVVEKYVPLTAPHITPMQHALRLEVERSMSEETNDNCFRKTIAALVHSLLDFPHADSWLLCATLVADTTQSSVAEIFKREYTKEHLKDWTRTVFNVKNLTENPFERGLTPRRRRDIGRALVAFETQRKGVSVAEGAVPDVEWIDVPKGECELGARDADYQMYMNLREPHPGDEPLEKMECNGFAISKYPVTVVQYQMFLEDRIGGYDYDANWQCDTGSKRPETRITAARAPK